MKTRLLILLLARCIILYGQERQPQKRIIQSVRTDLPVKVDGSLQEKVWDIAPVSSQFKQIEPKPGIDADFLTQVMTAYDDNYLYFAIVAHDSGKVGRYRAPDMKRDFAFQDHDLVGITIDGFNDRRNSMTFFVNAYGAQRDYLSFDDTYFDVDWNGIWEVKTVRTDSCWIAEFAIPWKTLRYKFDSEMRPQFGINFQRVRRKSNERSAWSPYPRGVGFNRMEYAGVISGFIPPKSTTNIQLNPYTLVSKHSKDDAEIKVGGELKWAINPNLVVDATLNTDFAQADVDQQVNNITRFSVLFPEKRQFFLENASLFGAGIYGDEGSSGNISLIPFFSRRIGLDNDNRPVPIVYGCRIVYRSLKRNYGTMFMQQKENELSPRSYYLVARYSENLGKYNRIGVVAATTIEDGNAMATSKQDHTVAVDGLVRINATNLLTGMFAMTAGSTVNNNGIAGYLKYQFTNSRVNVWLTSAMIDNHFDPKTGFISRRNIYAITPGIQVNLREGWLPFKNKLRDFIPGISAEFYYEPSTGNKLEQNIKVTPIAYNFTKGGKVSFSYLYNYQNIISDFRPLGIPIAYGEYQYDRLQFAVSSDGSKTFSYELIFETGGYFKSNLTTLNSSIVFAPDPHFSLSTSLNSNHFKGVGINDISKTINLYGLDSRIAISPMLQMNLIYQKNTNDGTAVYNARISWQYKPLSFIHLVYNGRGYTDPLIKSEQNAILKVSLLKQF